MTSHAMQQLTQLPRETGGEGLETTTVLVVSPIDLSACLGLTVLWRDEVRRVMVSTVEVALEVARLQRPRLIVVGGAALEATVQAIGELRAHPASRATAIVALDTSSGFEDEEALLAAGANVVLAVPVDPSVWDGRLEELLRAPPRRAVRVPTRFHVWSRTGEGAVADGLALNLSLHGMLLESKDPIEVGTTLDLSFLLAGQAREVRALGQVVRRAGAEDGWTRAGVEFLVLRGDARARLVAFVDGPTQRGRGKKDRSPAESPETSEWETELRARDAQKAAILESSLDAIVTVDHEGRVREFNRAAERMFGHARAEVIGRPMAKTLVPAARRGQWKQWLLREASLAHTHAIDHRLEATAQRANGAEFPVELTVTAMTHKGRTLLTFSMRDLSVPTPPRRETSRRSRARFEMDG